MFRSCIQVLAVLVSAVGAAPAPAAAMEPAWPEATWAEAQPEAAGLDTAALKAVSDFLGGRGCIVRYGRLVYHWGDITSRGDVASAVKPWFSTFLVLAVEDGTLSSFDTPLVAVEPRIGEINAAFGYKDRQITFRHLANQTSCYGVTETPGTAFDYNDWQMALFADTLFGTIYGVNWDTVDQAVLRPRLTALIQCEDDPTFSAFGPNGRRGRLGISPRDFARFGLLYLREGNWRGRQILSAANARQAVTSPLPATLPRTAGVQAEMIPGQRSLGSERVPDNQTDHFGGYSWLWWVNGIDREGQRMWPDAPEDTFCALGHKNGQRGIAVFPGWDLVMSWNDTTLGERPEQPRPLNEAFRLLKVGLRP